MKLRLYTKGVTGLPEKQRPGHPRFMGKGRGYPGGPQARL